MLSYSPCAQLAYDTLQKKKTEHTIPSPLLWPSCLPVFGRDISIYGAVTRNRRKKRAYAVCKNLIVK